VESPARREPAMLRDGGAAESPCSRWGCASAALSAGARLGLPAAALRASSAASQFDFAAVVGGTAASRLPAGAGCSVSLGAASGDGVGAGLSASSDALRVQTATMFDKVGAHSDFVGSASPETLLDGRCSRLCVH
jgi:hypothetical protein